MKLSVGKYCFLTKLHCWLMTAFIILSLVSCGANSPAPVPVPANQSPGFLHYKTLTTVNSNWSKLGTPSTQKLETGISTTDDYPAYPDTLIVDDIDNDGIDDLILTTELIHNQSNSINDSPKIVFYKNNGKGVFSHYTDYNRQSEEEITHTGDLNGDGIIDLAGYQFWGNRSFVRYGKNTSSGIRFPDMKTFSTATHGAEAYIIDINMDGGMDLVAGSSGSAVNFSLHLYTQNEQNSFTYSRHVNNVKGTSFHTTFTYASDINGDTYPDFVLLGKDRKIHVILSTGSGSYTVIDPGVELTDPRFSFADYAKLTLFRDIGGVFFLDVESSSVLEYRITSSGAITAKTITTNAPLSHSNYDDIIVQYGDLNSDGRVDLVYIKNDELFYALQNTNGFDTGVSIKKYYTSDDETKSNYDKPAIRPTESHNYTAIVDINGDNLNDLIVLYRNYKEKSHYIDVFLGS